VLEEIPEAAQSATYFLYYAISTYGNGREVDSELLADSLSEIDAAKLLPEDLSWFYLLQGLSAEFSGEAEVVAEAFKKAQESAVSDVQRAFFDGLILREELLKPSIDDSLVNTTRNRWKRYSGTANAYPYIRQYAIILYRRGDVEKAVEIINQELAAVGSGYENRQREQLLLLKGALYGVDTLSGRDTLRALLREGKNRETMATALQLLAGASGASEQAELEDFLSVLIDRAEPHPLIGQLYYLRSQLALSRGETSLAESDAKLLLEEFPGLSEITSVYRLLAYAALQRDPSQYRAAADFLIQMRDQSELVSEQKMLNRLIGDCYFLNEDYLNAVDFYKAAQPNLTGSSQEPILFLRLVTAAIRSGQIDMALQQIDAADFNESIPIEDQWRAEWNVVQALQAKGDSVAAWARVRTILQNTAGGSVPTALDLRLRWLEVRLAILLGELDGVEERMNLLLNRIESMPGDTMESVEIEQLLTEVLLLKADFLFKKGDSVAGIESLQKLRTDFAKSSAAERSYLTESGYYASIGDFQSAKKTLQDFVKAYANSIFAPQALYEAAIYCERLGSAEFTQAVRILDDLTKRYPTNPLYFSARLKQGNVLRKMNNFAAAQIIYENLIQSFPDHPSRYLAELARAECMLALAKDDPAQLQNTALALERLIDIPDLPAEFQVEVSFKWGFTLQQLGAEEEAQRVYSMVSSRFLLDDQSQLGPTGRYWLSRVLLELGTQLEKDGALAEARRVYRKIVAYNLPGRNLAQSRTNRLLIIEE